MSELKENIARFLEKEQVTCHEQEDNTFIIELQHADNRQVERYHIAIEDTAVHPVLMGSTNFSVGGFKRWIRSRKQFCGLTHSGNTSAEIDK